MYCQPVFIHIEISHLKNRSTAAIELLEIIGLIEFIKLITKEPTAERLMGSFKTYLPFNGRTAALQLVNHTMEF
jgi:hypothetical protein